MFKLLKIK